MTEPHIVDDPMDGTTKSAPSPIQNVADYKISQVLTAHTSDTRALALSESGALISGGRDEKVNWWAKRGAKYHQTQTLQQPKSLAVNSIAFTEIDDNWMLFVGRKDGTIAVYTAGADKPVKIFAEHTENVCCLHVNKSATHLLSGSWDTTVMIYPIRELDKDSFTALRCTGHAFSVWALASFPDYPDHYLTASADKTIRLWEKNQQVKVYNGHTDVVRALVVLSNEKFLSAGNDGCIFQWNVSSGTHIAKFETMTTHSHIYSMRLSDSHVLTTGEDGTLEFWNLDYAADGKVSVIPKSYIMLPTVTTWECVVFKDSDIAVAGSDGRIYILSNIEERQAPADIQEALEAEVVSKLAQREARDMKQQGDVVIIKVTLDDRPEQLDLKYAKGTDPALCAQEFLRENNLPVHYLDEIIKFIEAQVPEARAYKRKPGEKILVDGEEYDYALTVSLGKGEDMQMPFNVNESPEFAAQRFVEKKGLPISVINALAGMISQEMDKLSRSSGGAGYEDPFTGEGRYVPGGSSKSTQAVADPFTGSGRYVPANSGSDAMDSGFSGDPLTGDGGYRASKETAAYVPLSTRKQDKLRPVGEHIPLGNFYIIPLQGKGEKAVAKLKEFNETQDAFQLNPDQINCLEELFHVPTTSNYSSEVAQSAFEIGLQWPTKDITPVLDFFRIALTHESLNSFFCVGQRGRGLVERFIAILADSEDPSVKALVCRCIANAYAHPAGQSLFATTELSTLAPYVIKEAINEKYVIQFSAATALANWALALLKQSEVVEQLGPREDWLRAAIDRLENITSFGYMREDSMVRLLQGIVTIMWGDKAVIRLAKSRNIAAIAARIKDAAQQESTKHIARCIVEMVHAI